MGSVVFFFYSACDILKAPVYFENDGSSRLEKKEKKKEFGTADIWQGL